MNKDNFLLNLQNIIIQHPEWSGEAILAIKVVINAQEKINITEQKRLEKKGLSIDRFDKLNK